MSDALDSGSRPRTEQASQRLMDALVGALALPPIRMRVLERRPRRHWGELQGLYEPAEGDRRARITLWMRTARRVQVVAFRTFLRTFLHEFLHHLDYALYRFPDSFHTEGFYRRESSLLKQLLGESPLP